MKTLFKVILVCVPAVMFCSITLLTAGCKSQSALERTVTDTLRIEKKVTVRDTILKTTPVTATSSLTIPCPDVVVKPQVIRKGPVKLTVKQVGQILGFECLCDTQYIKAALRDTYEKQYHSKTDYQVKTEYKKYIPGYVKFFAWSGVALWLLVIIRLLIKIYLKK